MILHLAMFSWVEGTSDTEVAAATKALEAMAASIPEIRSYVCGPNLRIRPSAADFAVAAIVADEEDLIRYLDSPAHKQVQAAHLVAMTATRQTVQLSIGGANGFDVPGPQ